MRALAVAPDPRWRQGPLLCKWWADFQLRLCAGANFLLLCRRDVENSNHTHPNNFKKINPIRGNVRRAIVIQMKPPASSALLCFSRSLVADVDPSGSGMLFSGLLPVPVPARTQQLAGSDWRFGTHPMPRGLIRDPGPFKRRSACRHSPISRRHCAARCKTTAEQVPGKAGSRSALALVEHHAIAPRLLATVHGGIRAGHQRLQGFTRQIPGRAQGACHTQIRMEHL